MKVNLKKCEACGCHRDPLGFAKLGTLDVCMACQIDLEIDVNDLMKVFEENLRRKDKEVA